MLEEVRVGKLPLRLDILLIRREAGELSEASHQDLAVLLPFLNRFTLMQFKGPTDALQRGDLAQLVGCAFLWHSQQAEPIPQRDISLIVLAPTVNAAVRDELELLGCQIGEQEPGIFRVDGLPFAAWLVETDVMAERGPECRRSRRGFRPRRRACQETCPRICRLLGPSGTLVTTGWPCQAARSGERAHRPSDAGPATDWIADSLQAGFVRTSGTANKQAAPQRAGPRPSVPSDGARGGLE